MAKNTTLPTIVDVLYARRPEWKDAKALSAQAFYDNGLPFFSGCFVCGASLAPYNSHPGKNGYIVGSCCADEESCFTTVEEFEQWCKDNPPSETPDDDEDD